jgi:hypothetical protein
MVLVLTNVEYTCLYSLHKVFTLMIKTILLSLILFDSWTKEKVLDFIVCILIIINTQLISVHGSKNTITKIKPDCEITILHDITICGKHEQFLLHQHYS